MARTTAAWLRIVASTLGAAALLAPSGARGADFTVNTTADSSDSAPGDGSCSDASGQCSLRSAIQEANARFGSDRVLFAIPGPGPHRIAPLSAYPDISDFTGMEIDGRSQPGYAGTPQIELDGSALLADPGLRVIGGHVALRALNIHSFGTHGVILRGSHLNFITGCFVGTDPSGTTARPNGLYGIYILDSADNTIGGTGSGEGNLLSGNGSDGLHVSGLSPGTQVFGNLIGTDVGGSSALANGLRGITLSGATYSEVGSPDPAARNVISGNGLTGVMIQDGATFNMVRGNYIGTDRSGTLALGNLWGVVIDNSPENSVGGAGGVGGNLISGNLDAGLILEQPGASENLVAGNRIGVDATGLALGNGGAGVLLRSGSRNNLVGGPGAGDGNVIAFNGSAGVLIEDGLGQEVAGNSMFENSSIGIDLGTDSGVTPNDAGDGDAGANNLQNFPVITSAVADCASLSLAGTVDTADPSSVFRLEFFASAACDPSGHGEGKTLLGQSLVNSDAAGQIAFAVVLPVALNPGSLLTATATRPGRFGGNTSEFSACFTPLDNCTNCGNGLPDPGEDCDEGGIDTRNCDADCTLVVCGDRYRNSAVPEDCDEGGVDTPTCDSDCSLVACGDGHINAAAGEECDDRNTSGGDGCSATCKLELCSLTSLARVRPLVAARVATGGIDFVWPPDPAATEYHLNSVTAASSLVDPRTAPRGVGVRECTRASPATSCQLTAPVSTGAVVFYQLIGACGPTGDDEGPF